METTDSRLKAGTNEAQLVQLAPGHLQLFDQVSTRYDAMIGQGVDPVELLKPAFWAHQAVRLRPMDEIRARAEDGTWVATYVVLDCSRTWARVKELSFHRLTNAGVAETQASEAEVQAFINAHNVVYRGGEKKWSITRKSDKAVLEEGIGEKDAAAAKLEGFARTHLGVPPRLAKPAPVTA